MAPINPFNFVIGSTLTRFLISFLSVLIIMFSNNLIFHSQFDVYWPAFIVTVISSTRDDGSWCLLVIIFKSSGAAESAGVLMVFMVFLAGVYFPVSFLPKYLQYISAVLPIKYVADSVSLLLVWKA